MSLSFLTRLRRSTTIYRLRTRSFCGLAGAAWLATLLPLSAAQPRTMAELPDPSVEAEKNAFIIPEGYEVELWAAEPLLRKPVQMNWDSQGRLWVVCSTTYPQIKPGEEAIDQVVVLEDTDGDGKADKSTLFADDLHIPTAVIPADGGAYVANSTEILFLKDTDGDGKADVRQTILSGFGTEDTHHLIHTFRHTPEGAFSFNQSIYIHSHVETPWGVRRLMGGGIWDFRPETRRLEIVAKGLINPWGTEYDRWGQCFATDGAGSDGINYVFNGAVFATSPGAKRIIKGLNPGQPKQCGLEIISDNHFPEDWQGTMVTCDFRGNRVNRFRVEPSGSGFVSKQLPDVLASTHRGFRPIDVRTGPDGALYIADWFNPIIQHGEVDFRDPRRDRVNGRIWRLKAKGRALSPKTELTKASTAELVNRYVPSNRRWDSQFAAQELRLRDKKEASAAIRQALEKGDTAGDNASTLLRTAWALEAIHEHDPKTLSKLLSAPQYEVRAAGVRLLTLHLSEYPDAIKLLDRLVVDEHPQVRLGALGALRLLSTPDAVFVALRALDKPVDDNLDFLLELTCREQADAWLPLVIQELKQAPAASAEGKKPTLVSRIPASHLVYALKAANKAEALRPLLTLFSENKLSQDEILSVLQLAGQMGTATEVSSLLASYQALVPTEANAPTQIALLDALVAAGRRRVAPENGEARTAFFSDPRHVLATSGVGPGWQINILTRVNLLAGLWKQEGERARLQEVSVLSSDFGKDSSGLGLPESAVQGLVYLGGGKTRDFLKTLTVDNQPRAIRSLAITGLTDLSPEVGAQEAVAYLKTTTTTEEARPVLEAFLRNKKLPEVLSKALEGQTIPEPAAIEGIRLASSRGMAPLIEGALRKAGAVRQMDKPLSAEELKAMVAKVQQLGDPARGEKVYRRTQLLCISCHAIGETGGLIGPNMVSLGGSAPVDYIIESLTEPSKKIKEGYHMTMVTTKDGQVFAGAIAQDSGDELVIRDAANQLHKVAKSTIAQNTISPVSMMPPGLTASLREDEFLDLVRFLSELGKEGNYKTQPNKYIRTWRTMGVLEQADIDHVRHVGLFALNDRGYKYPWEIKFSLVNGDLPLAEIPVPQKMYPFFPRIAQCDLEQSEAGPVKLMLSATKGVIVTIGEKVIQEVTEDLSLELPAGKSTITFVITKDAGDIQNFRVEILDGPAKVVTTF